MGASTRKKYLLRKENLKVELGKGVGAEYEEKERDF